MGEFCKYRSLPRNRYEIGPWLPRNTNRKSYRLRLSIRVGCNDLKWHWKAGREGQTFLVDLHNYARMVRLTLTEFGMVPEVGQKRVSRGSITPHPKRATVIILPRNKVNLPHSRCRRLPGATTRVHSVSATTDRHAPQLKQQTRQLVWRRIIKRRSLGCDDVRRRKPIG